MAINEDRFRLALERIGSGDWEVFERLASTFLAQDYPDLRTMASPSGDGGRDATLYSDVDDPSLAFQYSVTENWRKKVRGTIKRLSETFPDVKSLMYITNQQIGADADGLKKELRAKGLFLDVLDRSWFIERANTTVAREAAAEALAVKLVDPLISNRTLDNELSPSLKGKEAQTALIFLEMQVQDSEASYGLTKSSYDALTRAALRATDTTNRLTRQQVVAAVRKFLPSHAPVVVQQRVDASLKRLEGDAIRYRKDRDEFHLTEAETARVAASVAKLARMKDDFDRDVLGELTTQSGVNIDRPEAFTVAARSIVESYFLRKGEDFAKSAIVEEPHQPDEISIREVVAQNSSLDFGISGKSKIIVMSDVVQSVLMAPTDSTSKYLKNLLDSYTLFAFLAASPDVQRATMKMFTSGEIWLDTSVVLPLLAESGASKTQTAFTQMYGQCIAAGLKLYVTAGVLEEVERHIHKCRTFVRSDAWDGPVPYLIASYLRFGGKEANFTAWVENFVGDIDPIQDIADYLRANHKIRVEDASSHPEVSEELEFAIRRVWQDIHINRRASVTGDTAHALRLADHDSETFLHVLSSRIAQRGKAPMGYSDWWLTLDRSARTIMEKLDRNLAPKVNIGPVMSIDYLLRYLTFGPNRERVDLTGAALAKIYGDALIEPLPLDMIETLEAVRAENMDVSEPIIQRRIRDRLNDERSRLGDIDAGAIDTVIETMRDTY